MPALIYHAVEYTGNPAAGGSLVSEQWAFPALGASRTEQDEQVTTQSAGPCAPSGVPLIDPQCVQMRQLTNLAPGKDAYAIYTGASQDDSRIGGKAFILEPAGFEQPPAARGPIADALEAWQAPPPGHGAEYLIFERPAQTEGGAATERIWVDSTMRLPLKAEMLSTAGERLHGTFFTYRRTLEPSELGPDFFAVAPTDDLVLLEEIRNVGADQVGEQEVPGTNQRYTPYFLGNTPTVAGVAYCLATSQIVHSEELVDLTPPGDVANDPDNALDSHPEAPEYSVGASYNPVLAGEPCVPGDGALDGPPLELISEPTEALSAEGWLETYRSEAEAIESDPGAGPGDGGVLEVVFEGATRSAYALPTAEGEMSVLFAGDDTQVTITGPFGVDQIPNIVGALQPQ